MVSLKIQKPQAIKFYLIAYNVVSFLAWFSILLLAVCHVAYPALSPPSPPHTPPKSSFLSSILPFKTASSPSAPSAPSLIPTIALPFYEQLYTTYTRVGKETTYAASFAALEVVHAFLGWVRSPVKTTALQVCSRAFIIWVIVRNFEQAQSSPFYTSMVLSWGLIETIRYPIYAISLLGAFRPPQFLVWLRYNLFFVLYPVGAASEAGLIYATLPKRGARWGVADVARALVFTIQWPVLYVMFSYMVQVRRKVLSKTAPVPSENGETKGKEIKAQ